jgi:transglutaminase-like putative cysteine protease
MTPGSIGELMQSNALVFRATFKDKVTDPTRFYWRGPVLSYFDGQTWYQAENEIKTWLTDEKTDISPQGQSYDVIMEASFADWLFPLETFISSNERLYFSSDYSVKSKSVMTKKQRFSFVSNQQVLLDLHLSEQLKTHYLELPDKGNPKVRQLARQLSQSTSDASTIVEKANAFFLSEPFVYSLKPPVYTNNRVDRFLFDSQTGFCEHFASSYVFLMRAAGVPARVVTGYQGGELNPYEGYVAVRQKDAHAWVEVWLSGKGWVRIDPTSFVAPHRIRMDLMSGLSFDEVTEPDWQAEPWFGQSVLDAIAFRYDQLGYLWSNFVVGFDAANQWALISGFFGLKSWTQKVLWLIAVFALCFVFIYLSLIGLPSRSTILPHERLYQKLIKRLAKQGVEKPLGAGPKAFLKKAVENLPEKKEPLENFMRLYIAKTYQKKSDDNSESLQQMKAYLKSI